MDYFAKRVRPGGSMVGLSMRVAELSGQATFGTRCRGGESSLRCQVTGNSTSPPGATPLSCLQPMSFTALGTGAKSTA
jgi:hypothetical protein